MRREEYELVGGDEYELGGDHVDADGMAKPTTLTSDEHNTHGLRRVPASLPLTTYLLAVVEFAERASYYGVSGVFANFVQRPLPEGSETGAPIGKGTPGALGMGLGASTAVSGLFTVLAFTSPLVGGMLADVKWGKFRTIAVGTAVSAIAHLLCVYAALPSVLKSGMAFSPFIVSVVLLGGATGALELECDANTGLIKANIAPLMAEQYARGDYVAFVDGERVVVEREGKFRVWSDG